MLCIKQESNLQTPLFDSCIFLFHWLLEKSVNANQSLWDPCVKYVISNCWLWRYSGVWFLIKNKNTKLKRAKVSLIVISVGHWTKFFRKKKDKKESILATVQLPDFHFPCCSQVEGLWILTNFYLPWELFRLFILRTFKNHNFI